jgi:hypothetical protein
MKLVNDMGFDAVDAGGLDESWRQQPATPVYTADLDMAGVRRLCAKPHASASRSGVPHPKARGASKRQREVESLKPKV